MNRRDITIAISIFLSFVLQTIIAPQNIFDFDVSNHVLFASLAISFLALYFVEASARPCNKLAWQFIYGFAFFAINIVTLLLISEAPKNAFLVLNQIEPRNLFFSTVFAFAVSVCEEIVFRRWLLGILLQRMHAFYAIIFSAAVFHICHFTLLPTPFFIGLVTGYLAYRYKTLIGAVLLHLIYDSFWHLGSVRPLDSINIKGSLDDISVLQSVSVISLCISVIIFLLYLSSSFSAKMYKAIKTKLICNIPNEN